MTAKQHIIRNIVLFTNIALIVGFISSCSLKKLVKSDNEILTKSLYMQFKHPTIELPADSSSNGHSNVVSEQVTYNHADNELGEKLRNDTTKKKQSINEMQTLGEVVVTAKSRFTPEHKGKVAVDFVIKVPRELLSSKWRVTLSPKLVVNDSVIDLQEVVLKGSNFVLMQKQQYTDYDNYLKSIVKQSSYDSVFLDRKQTEKDIRNIQHSFYQKYYSDWKKQKNYLQELALWQRRQNFFTAKQREFKAETYPLFMRKIYEEKIARTLKGLDTTGVYHRYMQEYNKKVTEMTAHYESRRQESMKFKPLNGQVGKPLHSLRARTFNKQDSINTARFRYDFKEITINEMKNEQKDLAFNQMVIYLNEENIRIDTTVETGKDFVYLYTKSYDVVPGLKKIQIYMDTKVDGIDQSSYFVPSSDTLSYFIASIAQLADTTLMHKVSHLTRIGYNQLTAYINYLPKGNPFNVNFKDNKEQTQKVIDFIDAIRKNKVYALDSIEIQVSRSLAGKFEANKILSEKHAQAFKNYLAASLGDSLQANTLFKEEGIGEDWNSLVREIQGSSKIVNKEEIINMLVSAKFPDTTEDDIRKKFKTDYAFIADSIYPRLNKTTVVFNLHRTDMTQDKEVRTEYKGDQYAEGLRLLLEREYWKALQILSNYSDYNTALCLACLGYNAKAYELLIELPKTADNEYLLALVCYRMKKEDEAVNHLSEAFKLDPNKRYRIKLDAEISELVDKYKI
jgi:hypothetical protein